MQLALAKRAKSIVAHSSATPPRSASCRLLYKSYTGFSFCMLSTPGRGSSFPGQSSVGNDLRPRTPDQHLQWQTHQPCKLVRVKSFCCKHEPPSIVREEGRPASPHVSRVNGWDASALEGRHKYRMTVAYDGTGLAGTNSRLLLNPSGIDRNDGTTVVLLAWTVRASDELRCKSISMFRQDLPHPDLGPLHLWTESVFISICIFPLEAGKAKPQSVRPIRYAQNR